MQTQSTRRFAARIGVVISLLVLSGLGIGCSETDSKPPLGATATPTATVTPVPTEEHQGPPHSIMEVGSTEAGGGKLTINEIPTAFVNASACLGGTGDECTGGTVAYTGDSPGVDDVRTEDSGLPIHKLLDGVEVSIEITAIDADASLLISGTLLDATGETAVVNRSPELHNHPIWQIVAPGGTEPGDKMISFRLHADGYESSDEITVLLTLFDEDDDHEHEDDEDVDTAQSVLLGS